MDCLPRTHKEPETPSECLRRYEHVPLDTSLDVMVFGMSPEESLQMWILDLDNPPKTGTESTGLIASEDRLSPEDSGIKTLGDDECLDICPNGCSTSQGHKSPSDVPSGPRVQSDPDVSFGPSVHSGPGVQSSLGFKSGSSLLSGPGVPSGSSVHSGPGVLSGSGVLSGPDVSSGQSVHSSPIVPSGSGVPTRLRVPSVPSVESGPGAQSESGAFSSQMSRES